MYLQQPCNAYNKGQLQSCFLRVFQRAGQFWGCIYPSFEHRQSSVHRWLLGASTCAWWTKGNVLRFLQPWPISPQQEILPGEGQNNRAVTVRSSTCLFMKCWGEVMYIVLKMYIFLLWVLTLLQLLGLSNICRICVALKLQMCVMTVLGAPLCCCRVGSCSGSCKATGQPQHQVLVELRRFGGATRVPTA